MNMTRLRTIGTVALVLIGTSLATLPGDFKLWETVEVTEAITSKRLEVGYRGIVDGHTKTKVKVKIGGLTWHVKPEKIKHVDPRDLFNEKMMQMQNSNALYISKKLLELEAVENNLQGTIASYENELKVKPIHKEDIQIRLQLFKAEMACLKEKGFFSIKPEYENIMNGEAKKYSEYYLKDWRVFGREYSEKRLREILGEADKRLHHLVEKLRQDRIVTVTFKKRPFGFTVFTTHKELILSSVESDSAKEAGLCAGLYVLTINNKPVSGQDHEDILNLLTKPELPPGGLEVSFGIRPLWQSRECKNMITFRFREPFLRLGRSSPARPTEPRLTGHRGRGYGGRRGGHADPQGCIHQKLNKASDTDDCKRAESHSDHVEDEERTADVKNKED